jgi:CxxC-x17-CxxC domain-containing protein
MHQGNWTCSGCGAAITELPFEPKRTDGLLCRDCHSKKKGSGTTQRADGDRPKFSGDWKCSSCGTAITSLPFEPRDTTNLKCIDCFKKSRG